LSRFATREKNVRENCSCGPFGQSLWVFRLLRSVREPTDFRAGVVKRIDELKLATSLSDVALLLGFQPKPFAWVIYKQPAKYTTFEIPKSRGGMRVIKAPEPKLKNVQARLAELLQDCIADINEARSQTEKLSHGFRRGHSIITNAYQHRRRRFVFNVDLADFFGTINFGRVRGFLMTNKHFALHERTATAIAHIVCYDNSLPQGAPTSPVVSNLIAHILDVRLAKLSRRFGLHYTRYADDLTFSTNSRTFPAEIGVSDGAGSWVAGPSLLKAIKRSGFQLNPQKTRMQLRQSRQDVTGLVVNEKVNIHAEYYRDARAKCDRLFKTGKYQAKQLVRKDDGTSAIEEVDGTLDQLEGTLSFIDAVKRHKQALGRDHKRSGAEQMYRKFLLYRHFYAPKMPVILCEGKTDNIYIRCAIQAFVDDYAKLAVEKDKRVELKVRLFNYSDHTKRLLGIAGGSGHFNGLINDYRKNLKPFSAPHAERFPVILLVDNDSGAKGIYECVKSATKQACDGQRPFYFLGENLYLVPTPLGTADAPTMIEDFLPAKWRIEKLGGKSLNLGKNIDITKEYGKALFAQHVIKKNRKDVDFTAMRSILDRIVNVIDDHAAMTGTAP
jgi:RNA-directed DNA polymerase